MGRTSNVISPNDYVADWNAEIWKTLPLHALLPPPTANLNAQNQLFFVPLTPQSSAVSSRLAGHPARESPAPMHILRSSASPMPETNKRARHRRRCRHHRRAVDGAASTSASRTGTDGAGSFYRGVRRQLARLGPLFGRGVYSLIASNGAIQPPLGSQCGGAVCCGKKRGCLGTAEAAKAAACRKVVT